MVIIPKHAKNLAKVLNEFIKAAHGRIFQADLIRVVGSKAWQRDVRSALFFWDSAIRVEHPGHCLIFTNKERNPRTGKKQIALYLGEKTTLINKNRYFRVHFGRGDHA